jgi:pyruvate formate lyase activating enzyme
MFLKSVAAASCMLGCMSAMHLSPLEPVWAGPLPAPDNEPAIPARFWEKLGNRQIRCKLCPRECVVGNGERGYCRVRENRGGTYYTLVHSRVVAAHIDPVEKKPFFHFQPGILALSVATGGCNVSCKFCQNWEISQVRPEQLRSMHLPPRRAAEIARDESCSAIAYTYSEPVVFSEYVMDTADAGHALGLKSIVVSNGFIQQAPLKALCDHVDAMKVDVKAFSERYYREVVGGQLKPVLEAAVAIRKYGKWTEIVYLVVPTLNDGDAEFKGLARWIKSDLGADVPVHFTRFQPLYLLKNLPPTPVETLERAKAVADAEGLQYVYIGNVPGHAAENTYCPKCHRLLVERLGFTIKQMHIHNGRCQYCQHTIPGVWS